MPSDKNPSLLQLVDNFVRGVANGITFGFADFVAGAADTAVSGGSFVENTVKEWQRTNDAGPEGVAGNFVGSAITGIGVAQASQEALKAEAVAIIIAGSTITNKAARDISAPHLKRYNSLTPLDACLVDAGVARARETGEQAGLSFSNSELNTMKEQLSNPSAVYRADGYAREGKAPWAKCLPKPAP